MALLQLKKVLLRCSARSLSARHTALCCLIYTHMTWLPQLCFAGIWDEPRCTCDSVCAWHIPISHLSTHCEIHILTEMEWNEVLSFFLMRNFVVMCSWFSFLFIFPVCSPPTSDLHNSEFRLMRLTWPRVIYIIHKGGPVDISWHTTTTTTQSIRRPPAN